MKLKFTLLFPFLLIPLLIQSQTNWDVLIQDNLKDIVKQHKAFVSIPNLPENEELMLKNINWVANNYKTHGFKINLLESSTLPLLLIEKEYNPEFKTVLFYFHIDGQPVDPRKWNQEDPFIPALKYKNEKGNWKTLNWDVIDKDIDDEWRICARAAADDKGPITMLFNALKFMKAEGVEPKFNIKIIFDPEEEYGSNAFLSTINKYKERYAADAMIIVDGPAHESNKPTLTFGCRGIARCTITTYGAKLPQHSGHFGNYVPNPVFSLSRILSSMKDENGNVLIKDFYSEINISPEEQQILNNVPDDIEALNKRLGITQAESVGNNYQEALQYPSLNLRQIETSWKGDKPKTIIPKIAMANIDVRLVVETDDKKQIDKVKAHIESLGYLVLDRDPTDDERLKHKKIVKFTRTNGVNAFRTDLNSNLGTTLRESLTEVFSELPISIRTMGGTVPIISAVKTLDIPAIIVPMVNMDNNQHSPNENIRIGNIRSGIKTCIAVLQTKIND
ncbi:M20/M25/M40 family metallo-hydrolase [Winogradskyella sp. PG-2]|uniref:M20/M25/M40 family metallo-hydrolase n=1 Tax=Winogradskyella sp. PG-2 TaxID=754409 RepID=UPI0004588BDF|nr:M20/M25/M40 family metallo-hydrolase [Winogradskyella sp. PG-2]BAO76276.1 acetylornithine deacetylase/Succinyl-diaminopimelate desuccinylase and related deacylases [Winogradskyella sp. PG-2]